MDKKREQVGEREVGADRKISVSCMHNCIEICNRCILHCRAGDLCGTAFCVYERVCMCTCVCKFICIPS